MSGTLPFDDLDETGTAARQVRRLALGGGLQYLRAEKHWKVADAASHADVAPMTWRRLEHGLQVRDGSYAKVDELLSLRPGSVKSALADDNAMLDLLRRIGVQIPRQASRDAAAVLEEFARATVANTPRLERVAPAVAPDTMRALAAAASHVPAIQPTVLQQVTRMLEQLDQATAELRTPAVQELIEAAAKAIPDLMRGQLDDADRDLAARPAQRQAAAS